MDSFVPLTRRCHSQSLFGHHRERSQGLPLLVQRLSHWLCEAISQAYLSFGMDPPESIRPHSTRGISSSTALHGGMSVEYICTAISWSSPCSFIQLYLQDVSHFSMTPLCTECFVRVIGTGCFSVRSPFCLLVLERHLPPSAPCGMFTVHNPHLHSSQQENYLFPGH